jgi:hypothetical protein
MSACALPLSLNPLLIVDTQCNSLITVQCRIRKCRCGGTRPEPCSGCVKEGLKCTWPTNDGRSAQARKARRKGKSRSPVDSNLTLPPETDSWNWMMNEDWLDTLSTTETWRSHSSYLARASEPLTKLIVDPYDPSEVQFHQDGESPQYDLSSHHSLSARPPERYPIPTTSTTFGRPILQVDDTTFQTGNTEQDQSTASSAWIPADVLLVPNPPFPQEGSNENILDSNTTLGRSIRQPPVLLRAQAPQQVPQDPCSLDRLSAWMAQDIFPDVNTLNTEDEPQQNTSTNDMDNMRLPDWLSAFDPSHFVSAMSSKLPTVEDERTAAEELPIPGTISPSGGTQLIGSTPNGGTRYRKTVKVTWWRPHGRTAIAPGW